jgi:8-oxo-dGTP pyrophosphatase MutT (NUDIX family)
MKAPDTERPRVLLVHRCFMKRVEDERFLLIRRSPTDTNNAGKWETAGGKVEIGQSLAFALETELLQETGLVVRSTHPPTHISDFYIPSGKYRKHTYLALFSIGRIVPGGVVRLSHEHTDYVWVTYDEMLAYDITEEVRKAAIHLKPQLLAA